jgi:hypothetical protein
MVLLGGVGQVEVHFGLSGFVLSRGKIGAQFTPNVP